MSFISLHFIIFFPLVTLTYFILPHRYRWLLLLIASFYFYTVFIPIYTIILLFVIGINYIAGIWIEKSYARLRTFLLIITIMANLSVLVIFKYFNAISYNLSLLVDFLGWNYSIEVLHIILPIGISFYLFQSISYIIEVYWGKQKAERHLGIFALYVSFFPQLVAGPIERPQRLLPQFREVHTFEYQRVTDGLKLMAWGVFKKVVIADRLALIVDQVYSNPQGYPGIILIIATIAFAYQIYCDFSGYSDIAIGAAQVMGFRLMNNFSSPYFAKSITEFWRRWHISLSTWFRDYLYIPLGGNRVNQWQWSFNIMIVFLLSGLWHGTSWNFVFWGAIHGFFLVFFVWTQSLRQKFVTTIGLHKLPRFHHALQVMITFSIVCFAWIFFRANIHDALYISTHLFSGMGDFISNITDFEMVSHTLGVLDLYQLTIAIIAISVLESVHIIQRKGSARIWLSQKPFLVRWGAYYMLILSILFLGVFSQSPFIYFQF